MKVVIPVVCGIVAKGNYMLIAQRPPYKSNALLWEFPGGKVEKGETNKEALKREFKEELNLDISVLGLLKSVLYENKTTDIKLMAYKVELLHPTQPIVLQEHLQYMWVTKQELNNYNLCAADEKLVKILFDKG